MEALTIEENQRLAKELIDYLQQDPNQEFQNCLPGRNRSYTGWDLLKRRILKYPPDKWKDIAREFNISIGNVTSDWDRYCKPLLAQIRQKIGYERE